MVYLFIISAVIIVGLVLYKDAAASEREEKVLESFRRKGEK